MAGTRELKTRPLLLSYIERIASSAFSEFPRQITDLVHGKHGVYALYKGDRLYYVGLATNLRMLSTRARGITSPISSPNAA